MGTEMRDTHLIITKNGGQVFAVGLFPNDDKRYMQIHQRPKKTIVRVWGDHEQTIDVSLTMKSGQFRAIVEGRRKRVEKGEVPWGILQDAQKALKEFGKI